MDVYNITQFGEPLDESQYTIDLDNKIFASKASNLVLDFTGIDNWTFRTGGNCTFMTGEYCTFTTTSNCTFTTGNKCTFDTGGDCTFDTEWSCTFQTRSNCTFKTESDCTFRTDYQCTFTTGRGCTFSLYDINTNKFNSYDGNSIILDREDLKHYLLTEEFIQLRKIKNG